MSIPEGINLKFRVGSCRIERELILRPGVEGQRGNDSVVLVNNRLASAVRHDNGSVASPVCSGLALVEEPPVGEVVCFARDQVEGLCNTASLGINDDGEEAAAETC